MGKRTECMCEALLRRPPSKRFHALEHYFVFTLPGLFRILVSQVFNFFSPDRQCSSDKFSLDSSWPFFFSHLCLFCLPRNAFTLVLYYLAILAKHINISPPASDGSPFFFAVRAAGTSEHAAGLWPFWKFWQDVGLHNDRSLRIYSKAINHDESSALAIQCETPCTTRLSFHGICNYFRSIWYDLHHSQRPNLYLFKVLGASQVFCESLPRQILLFGLLVIQGAHEYYSLTKKKIRSISHFLQPPAIDKEPESNAKMYINEMAWRDGVTLKAHTSPRAFPREISLNGKGAFFDRRFQPLFVVGGFSQTNGNRSVGAPRAHFRQKLKFGK